MYLDVVRPSHVEFVRQWRNKDISMYRTSFYLTEEMQRDFYNNIICNRHADHRYYSVFDEGYFIGMVGLVNISLENRSAEISIVIDPELRNKGFGKEALKLLLREGFDKVNLQNIYGECYKCSPALAWWENICHKTNTGIYELPARKYYNGEYYGAIYFNFVKDGYYDNI